jgi:hypothetical protein
LVLNPEGKIPLRKCDCGREDNIRVDFEEIVYRIAKWIDVAHERSNSGLM